jgi:GNAT superfamily N-acetyltransferase
MAVTIREVQGSSGTMEFIKLQWKFYQGDPNWVPPLLMDRKKVLDTKKNPFYTHSEIALFIADKNGEAMGRIAAITNENHNKTHEDSLGFFGFFECVDDQEVANALFDKAAEWLRSHNKIVMYGPVNPSVNDEVGMLLEGYDDPPRLLMTYNPEYYLGLCDNYGFSKAKDLYAYKLETDKVMNDKLMRGQKIVQERYNASIRNVDFKNMKQDMPILKDLYNRSWEKNYGAVAMTDAEFDFLAADLVQVVGKKFRDLVFFVELNGVPAGFALVLPDINEILISNRKGHIIPAAWKLMTQSNKITWCRIVVLGLLPEFRGKGLDVLMYYTVVTRAAEKGIRLGEASWVLEDNTMMNRGAELMQGTLYKKYRLYEKPI